MVLWGATFNAVVVVGVVSLLLFRLPMAILWAVEFLNEFKKSKPILFPIHLVSPIGILL
jgi:hypothetical protein